MTDFVQDLERELLAAARRRAARGRRRRPRIAWRPIAALAVAAAVVAGVLTLRPAAGEPRPAASAPSFVVPVADVPHPCSEPVLTHPAGVPAALTSMLAAVRAPRIVGDAMPKSFGQPRQWLPIAGYDASSVRRIPGYRSKLRVVPAGDLLTKPCAGPSRGAGACLVYGAGGERPQWGCFTVEEIKAGRAFMLVDASRAGARLIGLVPDGPALARVKLADQYLLMSVWRNGTLRYLQGLRPQRISVELLKTVWSVYVRDGAGDREATSRVVNQLKRDFGVPSFLDRTPVRASRERSVVYFPSAALEGEARQVAKRLGIGAVKRQPHDVKVAGPVDAPVLVVLGRMR